MSKLEQHSNVIAIEAKALSKEYRLYNKPSDRLKEVFVRRPLHNRFQALKDVHFSIPKGESVGIIGENGAGKSTLLKILAGTLTPSQGRLQVNGRVAALLELGTGFHPEFTGRQNIYLNAALLGLEQSQIAEKESHIIEFAELGNFIDQPIKTYSSGMNMRLAFSIATSVDPEILIIDEALSVGDNYFQQKCIDRMVAFREAGKTILFCSHSTYSVNLLCNRAIWIHQGLVHEDGPTVDVTADYTNFLARKTDAAAQEKPSESPAINAQLPVVIKSIRLNGQPGPIALRHREALNIELKYDNRSDAPFCIAMGIRRSGEKYWHAVNMTHDGHAPLTVKGIGMVILTYPSLPLLQGQYSIVGFILDDSGLLCHHKMESPPFTIVPPPEWNNEMGLLALDHEWKIS